MFEEIKKRFYESLIKSIKGRKKKLKLTQEDMLRDPKRVSKILHSKRDDKHRYLIGPSEYSYLNFLFLCEDHESFMKENIFNLKKEERIKKSGNNYDKMLWGHINWDEMFQGVIAELSKLDISEELGKNFEDTLVDYAPYAAIRYDELPHGYARKYIFPDERKKKREDAIEWVHLRHGSGLFKQIFYEKFSGKTLCEFNEGFHEFVSDYLGERRPKDHSLGLQTYSFHKAISRIAVYWQSLAEVQYNDMPEKKSDFQILLEEYIYNGRVQMKELEKYQQKFDALNIDIK